MEALTALVPAPGLLLSDLLSVTWAGASGTAAAGSHTTPQRPISETGLEIALPVLVLAFSLGKQVTVTYKIMRDGKPYPSQPFIQNIGTLTASALNPPKFIEADADDARCACPPPHTSRSSIGKGNDFISMSSPENRSEVVNLIQDGTVNKNYLIAAKHPPLVE